MKPQEIKEQITKKGIPTNPFNPFDTTVLDIDKLCEFLSTLTK